MAESTLSMSYSTLQSACGHFLGYGATASAWIAARVAEVKLYVNSGYRQFLYPPGLPDPTTGQPQARHTWSFLKPTRTITTASTVSEQTLPDDFGGMDGRMAYVTTDTLRQGVDITSESIIRDLRQGRSSSDTGVPYLAAIRPQKSDGTTPQRYEILWYPTPDGAYELSYRYNALQEELSDSRPYPLGGMPHGETLLESVLAVAEARGNDEKGLHWQNFMERLAASVSHDRGIRQPEFFGYCGDNSDVMETGRTYDRLVQVTYEPS